MENSDNNKTANFMTERLTEDAGKAFDQARYSLRSGN